MATMLLAACSGAPGGAGWVQVVPGGEDGALGVTFTGPDQMAFLVQTDDGLSFGTLDRRVEERSIVFDGVVSSPDLHDYTADPEPLTSAHVQLVKRPAGAEVWALIDGKIGRFGEEGRIQILLDLRDGTTLGRLRGAIAFSEQGDLLHVGIEGQGFRQYPVSFDTVVGEPVVVEGTVVGLGNEEVLGALPAPCRLAVWGDLVYMSFCDAGALQSPTGVWDGSRVLLPSEVSDRGPALPADGALAVGGGKMLMHRNGFACNLPIAATGGPDFASAEERVDDVCPYEAPYVGSWADRAAVSLDGEHFAVVYDRSAVILVEAEAPADASSDFTGLWCRLGGDPNLDQLNLRADNTASVSITPASGGVEAFFSAVSWQGKDDELTMTWSGGQEGIVDGDFVFTHTAHRVADTLFVRADPELDPEYGFIDPTGTWIRQDGETCQFGYEFIPQR